MLFNYFIEISNPLYQIIYNKNIINYFINKQSPNNFYNK